MRAPRVGMMVGSVEASWGCLQGIGKMESGKAESRRSELADMGRNGAAPVRELGMGGVESKPAPSES
jgi:hypothetical protein